MAMPRTFILIKGKPKALQVENVSLGENGVYNVKFKSSHTVFHYRSSDVVILNEAVWHDHTQCRVYIGGRERKDVEDILSFRQGSLTHWRITYGNGYVQDYRHEEICVVESCLSDDAAKNSFDYLKRVAKINKLGENEEHAGILSEFYEKIDFIDSSLAVAPYLNPSKNKIRRTKSPFLIFPFGCNASQEKAVTAAFENQLSVIQGPPGTGKTQTILNIIANILLQGKTVMVVSNNNSATANVREKLNKHGLDFIVAALGNRENKEAFVDQQPALPDGLAGWKTYANDRAGKKNRISVVQTGLRRIFALQEELALCRQEIKDVELEWTHFQKDNELAGNDCGKKSGVRSGKILSYWLRYQKYAEHDVSAAENPFEKIGKYMRLWWMNFYCKHVMKMESGFDARDAQPFIAELQSLYYVARIKELGVRISTLESELSSSDAKSLNGELVSLSMELLKGALYDKYHETDRTIFADARDLRMKSHDVLGQYPVVLSTTFSAKSSLSETVVYDFLVMDEASQVSVETGALALSCAKNAVIVGDSLQLPNVVVPEDKMKLDAIFSEYRLPQGYNSSNYSFLQSVCTVIPDIKQTLLREHYRCHPKIINFCNRKFYGGNLIIMTEDKGEDNVMSAIRTVQGKHCRGHYNQREIDVVLQEVLPYIPDKSEAGIITPYNSQVDAFNDQIPDIEAATVHKYQGREKDTIVMSVVDDQITEFSDDSNLLNVAISRAKRRFCIVLSGNEQKHQGNICELVDYINYNNFSVTDSKISSIFDYLYSHYTERRISFLAGSRRVSEYDSENLTYKLLTDIVSEYPEFGHLGVLCHTPLRNIFKDRSLMNDDEKRYVSHFATHLDFLLVNHVTKKPVLAIETDGYTYHNAGTVQHGRDMMKNHILELYGLPLLRLSTAGSGEYDRIVQTLKKLVLQ